MESKRDWFQILTNIGVILGIAVLIYQINQANTHAIAQLADANFQLGHASALTTLGENPAAVIAKAHEDPSALTLHERVILDAYHQSIYVELEHRNLMAQLGIFGDQWVVNAKSYASILAYPAGREWWARKRKVSKQLLLRDLIDEAVKGESNFEVRIQPYAPSS